MNKKTLVIIGVIIFCLVLIAITWVIATRGVSPEQRTADASAPSKPHVDIAIEERQLSDTVVLRGVAVAVDEQPVIVPEMSDRAAIVVALPKEPRDEVLAGDVVAVVADRPVAVLEMDVPLYRTLKPGLAGDDVRRLQQALNNLGFELETDGHFGSQTQNAVRTFYADRGFSVVDTGPEASQALENAEAAVRAARNAVAQQQSDLNRILSNPAPPGDSTATGSEVELSTAQRGLAEARAQLAEAETQRNRAAAQVGVVVPLGELVGVAKLPAVVTNVAAQVGQVSDGPLLSITAEEFALEATADSTLVPLLMPGTPATVGSDAWPAEVIDNLGLDANGLPIVRLKLNGSMPAEMLGTDLRIEATVAATDAPVIAVPLAAIRSNSTGEFVHVVQSSGETQPVAVQPGASIGGWVELVEPDQTLSPGVLVRLS